MPFTVATYNVLASAYIKPEWYAGVPAHLLDPAWRVPAVARSVAALDADLVCLQEVDRSGRRDTDLCRGGRFIYGAVDSGRGSASPARRYCSHRPPSG